MVSFANYWTWCQRTKKEKAAETCVLSCNLHGYSLTCLRRWLRNNPTENILLGLYVLALTCNITHRRALAAATSKPSSRFWCRLDDLIRLSAVSWPAETLRHARGDKTIDRKRLQWDSSGASPPFQTAWACLHFPLHLLSQSECVFRPLGGERGGEFPGGNFWGEDHN